MMEGEEEEEEEVEANEFPIWPIYSAGAGT